MQTTKRYILVLRGLVLMPPGSSLGTQSMSDGQKKRQNHYARRFTSSHIEVIVSLSITNHETAACFRAESGSICDR